jgi:pimeloyl-ACP methyl ester carboxylesterase
MLRDFANLPERQVHFRHAGAGGVPLLLLHASPGSSRQLDALGDALAQTRRVLATDRPGNGDSQPLPIVQPETADYARAEWACLDTLGIETIDVYGSHTGACIATEMAIQAPSRVRRVILDGIGIFTDEEAAAYLARYAPTMQPDLAGQYLQWVFQFCRDQVLFFPWFEPTQENARARGLPPAPALHAVVLEVLKSLGTYHLGYNASFRYPARARLPLLTHPVLAVAATADPLRRNLDEAVQLIPNVFTSTPHDDIATLAVKITDFLDV